MRKIIKETDDKINAFKTIRDQFPINSDDWEHWNEQIQNTIETALSKYEFDSDDMPYDIECYFDAKATDVCVFHGNDPEHVYVHVDYKLTACVGRYTSDGELIDNDEREDKDSVTIEDAPLDFDLILDEIYQSMRDSANYLFPEDEDDYYTDED